MEGCLLHTAVRCRYHTRCHRPFGPPWNFRRVLSRSKAEARQWRVLTPMDRQVATMPSGAAALSVPPAKSTLMQSLATCAGFRLQGHLSTGSPTGRRSGTAPQRGARGARRWSRSAQAGSRSPLAAVVYSTRGHILEARRSRCGVASPTLAVSAARDEPSVATPRVSTCREPRIDIRSRFGLQAGCGSPRLEIWSTTSHRRSGPALGRP